MTDYYTCRDCNGSILHCGCPGSAQAIAQERFRKRKASKVCSWHAVLKTACGTVEFILQDACHELDAVTQAKSLANVKALRLLRVTKTITETVWNHDDPTATD